MEWHDHVVAIVTARHEDANQGLVISKGDPAFGLLGESANPTQVFNRGGQGRHSKAATGRFQEISSILCHGIYLFT
jgi:hypothetical protein